MPASASIHDFLPACAAAEGSGAGGVQGCLVQGYLVQDNLVQGCATCLVHGTALQKTGPMMLMGLLAIRVPIHELICTKNSHDLD